MRLARQEGQTATEYMLIISVVVIAVVAAAYAFVPTFKDGVNSLADDVESILRTGQIGGIGEPRNYNTASNNARRCNEQADDPRYAAMFDPPKCLEDPAPILPAATPAPSTVVFHAPRAAHAIETSTPADEDGDAPPATIANVDVLPSRARISLRRARRSSART